ncbi:hypothetical protein [Neorhizobium sp. DT-125]|uniref:hypothetical protein n=1 Tax=Neorhizobium sp. DT-125 TaxID=3396163 RepID=UPI003F1C22FD
MSDEFVCPPGNHVLEPVRHLEHAFDRILQLIELERGARKRRDAIDLGSCHEKLIADTSEQVCRDLVAMQSERRL